MRHRPSAFPKRREGDQPQSQFGLRMISFTDLMAVLLSFFILLYATRDPIPPQRLPPGLNAIPAIVAQPVLKTESALAKPLTGLDLNYVSALLRQSALRDPALEGMTIATYPFSLVITLANPNENNLNALLEKITTYKRTIQIFAEPEIVNKLMAQNSDKAIRYFPQDRASSPRILIH